MYSLWLHLRKVNDDSVPMNLIEIYVFLNGQCLHGSKRFTALWFIIFITTFIPVLTPHFRPFICFLPFWMFITSFIRLITLTNSRFWYFIPKYTISSSTFLPKTRFNLCFAFIRTWIFSTWILVFLVFFIWVNVVIWKRKIDLGVENLPQICINKYTDKKQIKHL